MAREIVKKGENFVVYSDGCVRVDNVRLSYPHLAAPWAQNEINPETGKPSLKKFSMKGLGAKDTHNGVKDALVEIINKLCAEKKFGKLGADKKFIRNGDDLSGEENEGSWVISASENANRPPKLRDARGNPVTGDEAETLFYPGCYVDMLIRPWAQDSKDFGKRINSNLIAVKFREDGERFGEAPIDDEGVFEQSDDGFGDDDDL